MTNPIDLLEGVWAVEWTRTNGHPKLRERCLYAFSEDTLSMVRDDGNSEFEYSTDRGVSPAQIDWSHSFVPYPWLGIYSIEHERLTICSTMFGLPRPMEFATKVGDMRTLTVLRWVANYDSANTTIDLSALLVRQYGDAPLKDEFVYPEFDQEAEEEVHRVFLAITDQPALDFHILYKDVLTEREKTVFNVERLITEVENGGLFQFFRNPIGYYAQDVVRQLRDIGAFETEDIVREACNVFPDGTPASNQMARHEQLESFTLEQDEQLDNLTTKFYRRTEDLRKLLLRYWEAQ